MPFYRVMAHMNLTRMTKLILLSVTAAIVGFGAAPVAQADPLCVDVERTVQKALEPTGLGGVVRIPYC